MVSKEVIQSKLKSCLRSTKFLEIPGGTQGKVRDIYEIEVDGQRVMIFVTTDRQSAFDRVLAAVPFKGQVLNQVSAFWFKNTEDIVPNAVIDIPDPNITVAKKVSVLPIEFVVRRYLTGSTSTSAWTHYEKGVRNICGNILPDGMVKNQKFDEPILTPTTKSDEHDEPISVAQIVEREILSQDVVDEAKRISFALFARGQEIAAKNGLILVDTKYEFGIDEAGKIYLIDEIHTPDSSRYWISSSYEERFAVGQEPENIDKEFLRLWFKKNCDPYKDKRLPKAPDELVIELSRRYIQLYEMITGLEFKFDPTPIRKRMRANMQKFMRKCLSE